MSGRRESSNLPAMPWFASDYEQDTWQIHPLADLLYRRLLDVYWRSKCRLRLNHDALPRLVRFTPDEWETHWEAVAGFWVVDTDGWMSNPRADHEWQFVTSRVAKKRAAARAKWGDGSETPAEMPASEAFSRHLTASEMRAKRLTAARQLGRHTNEQFAEMRKRCDNVCVRCGVNESRVRDHIVPIYQGGSDGLENLQPLCISCNSSKGPEVLDHRSAEVANWAFEVSKAHNNPLGMPAVEAFKRLQNACKTPPPTPTPTHIDPPDGGSPPKPPKGGRVRAKPTKAQLLAMDLPGGVPHATWQAWVEHRVAIRKPLGIQAAPASLRTLAEWAAQGLDVRRAVEHCIASGWQSLNPTGATPAPVNGHGQPPMTRYERAKAGIWASTPNTPADLEPQTGGTPNGRTIEH